MYLRSLSIVVAVLAVGVWTEAGDKEQQPTKDKPIAAALGNAVGEVVCGRCEFNATSTCSTALKMGDKQFVLVAGKVADGLFDERESGKLVRVFGALTVEDGVATIAGVKSAEVQNKKAKPSLTLSGKLVCTKCEFKIGEECGIGLKAGKLQVVLVGDAAKELFKRRCSGDPKVATGALTQVKENTLYLNASKVTDPKKRPAKQRKPAKS